MKTKITISETETSHPYTGPNGDRCSIYGFSVFSDRNLIGVVATNGRGLHKYRARLLAEGRCLASEGFATMDEAVQFIADESAKA
jgi:hypothetical protein